MRGKSRKKPWNYDQFKLTKRVAGRYFDLAFNAYERGEIERSIRFYTDCIRLDSKRSEAFYNRGISFTDLGEIEKAMADYEKAIRLDSNYSEALNNLGNRYYFQDKFDEAFKLYSAAIEADPFNAEPYLGRGNIRPNADDRERARNDYERHIELAENPVKGYTGLANFYFEEGEYEKAIDACNTALSHVPDDALAFLNRGYSLKQLGRIDGAINDFSRVIEIGGQYQKRAYNGRALCYKSLERPDLAEADEKKASELL